MVHLRASLSPNPRHLPPPTHTHIASVHPTSAHTHIHTYTHCSVHSTSAHTHIHTHTLLLFIQQASTVPGTGKFCGRVQGKLNMMPILEKYVISCVGSVGKLAK